MDKLRVMQLLEEARARIWTSSIEIKPARLRYRAETIERKIIDLIEELRMIT